MQVRLLGPVELVGLAGPIGVGGPKERALLAILALRPGEVVSEDALVDALWGDEPPRTAVKTLRSYVSRLRRVLADVAEAEGESVVVDSRPPGYVLRVGPNGRDVDEVESLLENARTAIAGGDAAWASVAFAQVLRMWRGRSLGEFADEAFARAEATRLEELRAAVLEERIDAELRCGRHAVVLGELEALTAAHPLRERLWGQRMTALYRAGRQAEALRVYQELRAILGDELGIEPSPALAQLEQDVLLQRPSLDWAPAPEVAAVTAASPAADLPSGVVTFLLTDIEDSTALWDRDAASMAEALAAHERVIATVVTSAGGQVLKARGEGDATLSVFRRASEAAAAALSLQSALAAEAWPGGLDLRVRVALHTGEAFERDGDYFGPTLNRAARLRSLAVGGQVIVSQATAEVIHDHLPEGAELVDLGRHELRGLARHEQVFELCGPGLSTKGTTATPATPAAPAAPQPLRMPLPAALETAGPFVGRETQLDGLVAVWNEVKDGQRGSVLVAGEPGIGKTRLVAELANRIHAEGGVVLFGRCDEDLGVAFQPFAAALSQFVSQCPTAGLRDLLGPLPGELVRLAPELTERVPGLPAPLHADPETDRYRLFEAVVGWLSAVAAHTPVVLVIDDLHWATKPTLMLLRHLSRHESVGSVLVAATYRDTELDRAHPLADTLADLRRDAGVERRRLDGLDRAGVARYLEEAGGEALDEGELRLAAELHAQTDGNPFFISEVLRNLVESGDLYRQDGRWVTKPGAGGLSQLPEGVKEVVTRRLSRLSEGTNKVLAVASLIGLVFQRRVLEGVPEAADDRDAVLEALDEAQRAGIVLESGDNFAFAHALIRQTLEAELTSARRARLHRRIGEAIESLPDADDHVVALAHHFAEAGLDGLVAKAADYALAAGRRAVERGAHEEAITQLERGLSLLELESPPDPGRDSDLRYALATAWWALGRRRNAHDAALAAAQAARQGRDGQRLARAAILLAAVQGMGAPDAAARAACEEALASLEESQVALRARTMAALARYLIQCEGDRAGVEVSRQAVALARREGDPKLLIPALEARILGVVGAGEGDLQLALVDELVDVARRTGDVRSQVTALITRSSVRLAWGDIEGVRADVAALEQLGAGQRWWLPLALASVARAGLAALDGNFDEAMRLSVDARAHAPNDADVWLVTASLFRMVQRDRGRWDDDRLLAIDADTHPGTAGLMAGLRASVFAHRGDLVRAEEELNLVVRGGTVIGPLESTEAFGRPDAAEACALLGRRDDAGALYDQLLAYAGRLMIDGRGHCSVGAADRFLGMLAATMQRWDPAESHFAAALELEARVDSPVLLAQTRVWYGRMLLERDGHGDRAKAIDLLGQSLEAANALGLKWVAGEARRLLRPPLPPALASSAQAVSFVGRDSEVAQLLAHWESVNAGGRQVVLVAGEPGIGKSRLAAELADRVYGDGGVVLFGRCDEDLGVPYQPFVEALRSYVESCPVSDLVAHVDAYGSDLVRLLPELGRRVPDLAPPLSADPDTERFRMFEAVTALLAQASSREPVLLVIDDLHWAAKPTLLLLRHVLRAEETRGLLVVATYRDTDVERSHPLAELVGDLRRDDVVERIALRGLDEDEVGAFVAAGSGELSERDADLARALYASTEGNPFFMNEVLAHLVETGVIARSEDGWSTEATVSRDLVLPEGIRDVITRRLTRLPDAANAMLAVAAVAGQHVDRAVLERVPDAADTPDALLDALDAAVRAGILVEVAAGYAFTHALVRQTLDAELTAARRMRLHRRVGEAIESLPDADTHVEALAHHFAEAALDGQIAKAADYALSAGEVASERLASEEACAHLERGLAVVELDATPDRERQADLLLALAEARYATGDVHSAQVAALSGADAARTVGAAPFGEAVLLLTRWEPVFSGTEELGRLCDEAIARLGHDQPSLRARLLAGLARHMSYGQGRVDEALPIASAALDLARSAGDPMSLSAALASWAIVSASSPDVSARLATFDELVDVAGAGGDSASLAFALYFRAVARLQAGDRDGFDADAAALSQFGTLHRSGPVLADAAALRAMRALLVGQFDDLRGCHAEIRGYSGSDPELDALMLVQVANRFFESGRAAANIPGTLELIDSGLVPYFKAGLRAFLAHYQAEAGDFLAAREVFGDLAPEEFVAIPRDAAWPGLLTALASTAARLGDVERAAILRRLAEPYAGLLCVPNRGYCNGAFDRYLGMLATTMGDFDAAEAHLEVARELEERVGGRPHVARTQLWYAKMLLARDDDGDRARALELLEESLATAEELGMAGVASEARGLLPS